MKSAFKTIQFKLTLWYSLILIFFSVIFLISINLFIAYQYNQDPLTWGGAPIFSARQIPPHLRELNEEKAELILESREQDLQTMRELSVLSLVPLILVSFGGGYLIADQMLRPLKKLNSTMSTITSDQLSTKISFEDTGDEISELIKNFNSMITRLNASFESQKQFVENASHELKTPLAVMQTNLEAALSQERISKKRLRELLTTATQSSKFMNKLLDDLLLLAVLNQKIQTRPLNLSNVVKRSISQLKPLAKQSRISISAEFPKKKIRVDANEVLLQRAIMNVIENAIKYSPKNSTIIVKVYTRGDNVFVSAKDSGPGISKKEETKIFDRFYRVDKSRSRKSGGTGLGLSITKEIIESHGGRISLRSGKKGSTFTISLPLS